MRKWDGGKIWPQLSGAAPIKPRTIYIAGTGFRERALRDGEMKLIIRQGNGKTKGAETAELYDLAKDPNEATDLAGQQPEMVSFLHTKLEEISKADRDAEAND